MEESNVQFVRSPVTVIYLYYYHQSLIVLMFLQYFYEDMWRHTRAILRPSRII